MTAAALNINDFLSNSRQELIIDVRAPVEFKKGHLPGAVNIPLFEDIERAEIGTLFKQQGKDTAVTRGLEIVSPKMVGFVNQVRQLSKNKNVFVYCFRGGMRSNSFAWLMNTSGLNARILKGGYKSYRNHVLNYFAQPQQLILLGGHTGSGKTDIIKHLAQSGVQTIDLEGLANHKGSAFGGINEDKQPSQQNFEHGLYQAFQKLDVMKSIVLEDESKSIGYNKIPHALWLQMKQATIVKLDIPFELRIENLVKDYATTDIEALKACVVKIAQQLGLLNTKLCLQYLDEGNLHDTARLTLQYYDKVYGYTYSQKQQPVIPVVSDTMDVVANAQKVKQIIDSLH
jgi:tRNA 2-selenouridine synthase